MCTVIGYNAHIITVYCVYSYRVHVWYSVCTYTILNDLMSTTVHVWQPGAVPSSSYTPYTTHIHSIHDTHTLYTLEQIYFIHDTHISYTSYTNCSGP